MQEAETGRIVVPGQPWGEKVHEILPQGKKPGMVVCTSHLSYGRKYK
jgi:hypothetical protein